MTMIVSGSPAAFTVAVQLNGAPVPLAGAILARVLSMDSRVVLVPEKTLDPAAAGTDLASGIVGVSLTDAETALIPAGDAMLVLSGSFGMRRFRLVAETLAPATRNSLFVRDIVVDEIRRDRLMSASAGVLQDLKVSDQYLWEKVRAAESDLSNILRVPLVPTQFYPVPPTDAELAAIGDQAWEIDPGYDYEASMFERDKWGYLVTRHRPIISVEYMRFAYPTQEQGFFEIPQTWIRIDARPGHLRIVPSGVSTFLGMAPLMMASFIDRRTVPNMLQVSYTAGLKDAANDYPELIDVIKKKAVLKIVADAFLPQSGSISADGLSESMSVDMSKYSEAIDEIINGPKGSNGGLMTKIHGIRSMVF